MSVPHPHTEEQNLRAIRLLTRDGWVLFSTRMVRLFAYGLLSVVLALYLAAVGLSEQEIGLLLTLTLVGDALVSLLITRVADRVGRRWMLRAGAGLMILAGVVFALSSNPLLLTLAAGIGTLSPSGNEVGPFLAIEQAALAHIIPGRQRTVLFTVLSGRVEVEATPGSRTPSFSGLPQSYTIVRNLSVLFMIDSFAGGLVVQSLLAYWLHLRFGADATALGQLFFGVHLLAGLSALVAARIAARFGLINTMVFTHLPANVFLILIPLMPNLSLAMAVILLRYCMAQMDVPARHSYLMAMVAPDERSAAAGVTTVARTASSAFAPSLTGALLGAGFLNLPFFLAGGMKIAYDLALYAGFRNIKTPEEKDSARE